jgi:hypothetical protein
MYPDEAGGLARTRRQHVKLSDWGRHVVKATPAACAEYFCDAYKCPSGQGLRHVKASGTVCLNPMRREQPGRCDDAMCCELTCDGVKCASSLGCVLSSTAARCDIGVVLGRMGGQTAQWPNAVALLRVSPCRARATSQCTSKTTQCAASMHARSLDAAKDRARRWGSTRRRAPWSTCYR